MIQLQYLEKGHGFKAKARTRKIKFLKDTRRSRPRTASLVMSESLIAESNASRASEINCI